MVFRLFAKYDMNRSGSLDRRETLRLLNDILDNKGKPPANMNVVDRFFAEYDANGDGTISRHELHTFVKEFLANNITLKQK